MQLPDVVQYDYDVENGMKILGYTAVHKWEIAYKDGKEYTDCFIRNPYKIIAKQTDKNKLIKDIIDILKSNKRVFKTTEKKITDELNKYDYSVIYSVKVALEKIEDFSKDTFKMVSNIAKVKSKHIKVGDNIKDTANIINDVFVKLQK